MIETATRVGPNRLMGIMTRPSEPGALENAAIVLLNAGLVHRVGPNRLNVELARRLADEGFPVLRFDMSGVGDSGRAPGGLPYEEQAIEDVRAALDAAADETGNDRFVVIGLCTGAYNALAAASADSRIVGCALIDGYAYPTRRYHIRNKAKKITQLWRWKRYVRRRLGLTPQDGPAVARGDSMVFQPSLLSKEEYGKTMRALVSRGARVHVSYVGDSPQPYNYEGQFFDLFPDLDREEVTILYMPDANHTFSLPPHRRELIDHLADWAGGFSAD